MKRTPEDHELMHGEDVEAYTAMDFSEPHDSFIATFQRLFPEFSRGLVLDIGCGNADPTIRFARVYQDAQLIGIDGSESMLMFARDAVEREGLSDQIRFEQGMLQDYEVVPSSFDVIICNSLLHHIEPVSSLWDTIRKLAKKGSPVLVMDFMRPDSLDVAKALEEQYAGDSPESMTRGFYNSLLAAYMPEEVYIQLNEAGLSNFNVEVISDRHMIIFGKA